MEDYLTILTGLLLAALGGIIGFASAYIFQKQQFKRENLLERRDKIYGPIFMELSKISETIRSFTYIGYPGVENLKNIMDDYLFYADVKTELKSKLSGLLGTIEIYSTVRYAAEECFNNIIREEIKKTFKVDSTEAILQLLIGKAFAKGISLKETVFLNLEPKDFIAKGRETYGRDIATEVRIGGNRYSLQDFESLYTHMLYQMNKESRYVDEKNLRMRLLEELESFLEQIREFVTFS
jgi:hypothetical protein